MQAEAKINKDELNSFVQGGKLRQARQDAEADPHHWLWGAIRRETVECPIWRGLRVDSDDPLLKKQVGDAVEIAPSSFSKDPRVAYLFCRRLTDDEIARAHVWWTWADKMPNEYPEAVLLKVYGSWDNFGKRFRQIHGIDCNRHRPTGYASLKTAWADYLEEVISAGQFVVRGRIKQGEVNAFILQEQ